MATQHPLPSGRYSLLGPDFHRLVRTSLRLAHLFNHLVGQQLHGNWYLDAKRLGSLEVDHQLEPSRLLHRQMGWLGALQYLVNKRGSSSEQGRDICTLGQQGSRFCGKAAEGANHQWRKNPSARS